MIAVARSMFEAGWPSEGPNWRQPIRIESMYLVMADFAFTLRSKLY